MYYFFNIAVAILLIISAIACTTDPQTITTEVTREVPVTVETVQTVEVTRQIPVQVPVTVEVNREVQSTKIVEITREVPVTRLVEITPTAAPSPTVSAMATGIPVTVAPTPDPTITPTASPTVAPTKTPMSTSTPAPQKSFGSWQMRAEPEHIGLHDVLYFDNLAQEWGQKTEKPKLVYQCNSRGQRAVYIDWNVPLATQTSYAPRYTDDPLRQYRDDDLEALIALSDGMLRFLSQVTIPPRDAGKLEEMWKSLQDRWNLDADEAASLLKRIDQRNHRSVQIATIFHISEKNNPVS